MKRGGCRIIFLNNKMCTVHTSRVHCYNRDVRIEVCIHGVCLCLHGNTLLSDMTAASTPFQHDTRWEHNVEIFFLQADHLKSRRAAANAPTHFDVCGENQSTISRFAGMLPYTTENFCDICIIIWSFVCLSTRSPYTILLSHGHVECIPLAALGDNYETPHWIALVHALPGK